MDWLFRRFSLSEDLGIDLGTANTLVASQDRGILLDEPSVVAVYKGTNEVILDGMGVGDEAYRMLGKTPTNIEAVRPLKGGVIADFEITEKLLRYFLRKAHEGRSWVRPRVVISVPSGITTVERRAVINSAERAGARKVYLVDEPMAAGLGVELPITEAQGSMVVDIGGGTTEVAILALGGPVTVKSVKVAGDNMDDAIVDFVRKTHNLQIGPLTAELVKKTIGSAWALDSEKTIEVAGRDSLNLMPRKLVLNSEEIRDALDTPLRGIMRAVLDCLEMAPPEIGSDLLEQGITIVGGGALLPGLDQYVSKSTGLPCAIDSEPLTAVARGTAKFLEDLDLYATFLSDGEDLA
ncbi:MAG: rod shape-determining protein [Planctomycetes bacterium]|nr:rod shape-determining protein [Planctomycetota bacterium]MCP4772327.1 rod shape-determining protein [Planctomycetota bacterium]MCP4861573.1 rod shape-determining protein [Planctomycetota bacterium]